MASNRSKVKYSPLIFLIIGIKSVTGYSVISQYPKIERSLETTITVTDNDIEDNSIEQSPKPSAPQEPEDEFNGVYSECVLHLSFVCIQNKTLNYLKILNEKAEVPIYGNILKFVKTKKHVPENETKLFYLPSNPADEIDRKIDEFFGTHVLRVRFGKEFQEDIDIGRMMETTEGRKKEKEDKNKKMMMMAMMMMKMKMMMMVPAMMGMTGVIAFKALILGAISLLISKILLIMKLMGGGGKMGSQGGHGGADVTVWMPSGGSGGGMGGWDSHGSGGGGGGGGGYNANGEWQNRAGWDGPQILRGIRTDRKRREANQNDKPNKIKENNIRNNIKEGKLHGDKITTNSFEKVENFIGIAEDEINVDDKTQMNNGKEIEETVKELLDKIGKIVRQTNSIHATKETPRGQRNLIRDEFDIKEARFIPFKL